MKQVKVLVIRLSSIGDIILTSPVVRTLKKQFSDIEIHFLTKKENAGLLAHNPNISRLYLLNKKRTRSAIKILRHENYDYIIDLHKNLRTWWIKRRLHAKSVSFKKLNIKKWLLTNFKINHLPNIHIVDRYMATLKHWRVVNDRQGLDFAIPSNVVLPQYFNEPIPFAALVLGAQHATKKIPYSKLLFLCQHINYPIALLGGVSEQCDGAALEKECPDRVRNFCGKLNIHQSAKVLQMSRLVIATDTGLMHIASALKKDIFSVWGNTVPDFGMYPYMAGAHSQIFEVEGLKCRPCSKIGFDKCPHKHFNCMMQQDFGKLAEAVNRQMAQ